MKNKFTVILLYFVIVWTNLYKFVLIRQGFLTEPDERRYFQTWIFLKHLLSGDWQVAVRAVFSAQARPGSVLLHVIPASLQFLSAKIRGVELFETNNSDVVFVYNFFIFGLTLVVLYRLFQLIFKNRILSLTGVLFYSVLVVNFSYIRHIYPYDESLLIFIFLVYKLAKNYRIKRVYSPKFAFWTGLLAFFAFLVYPAHYLIFMAVYVLFNLLLWQKKIAVKQAFSLNAAYIGGSVLLLLVFEMFSGFGQTSYIYNLLHLSGTVNQGDYNEAFSFIIKYFWQVEHFTGLVLLLGLLIFPVIYLASKMPSKSITGLIVLSFLIMYLMYAVSSYFLHNLVLMGRILHQFIFVIVLMNLFVFEGLSDVLRKYFIILLTLVLTIQFYFQIQDYLQISYPRDVYWRYLKTYPFSQIREISEYENSWSNLPKRLDGIYIDKTKQDTITVVNGQYFYPVDDKTKCHKYRSNQSKKLIFNKLHFVNYKAYQFEGYDFKARKILDSCRFRIRIYK